ncbi:MAG TPA: lysophospholipid acyltransferase family protein [Longimicrobiales bacterium]|nr:lysophospholipid acyltransferase family protein [Longimicrobiales bacterium]
MIRAAWVALNTLVGTLLLGPILVVAGVLGVRNARLYDWGGRTWSRWILWASATPVKVEGAENIDPDSPQILVGNHQSWYDVFAVAGNLDKTFHFVAKKELERVPLFGRAWKAAGHVSIDRSDQARAIASLDEAGRRLREDRSAVVIFAEGTRSPHDDLLPFKKGAFMLALHARVPIVPFGVAGTRRIQPKGGWRVRKGPIILRFGEPIPTDGFGPGDRDALLRRVRDQVRRLRDGARAELTPGRIESPNPNQSH